MDLKENQIAVNVLRVSAYLLREGNRIASKYQLNQQQFVVLNYIHNTVEVHQNDICSSLVYEKSNVSKIVKKLEKLDYVSLRVDGENARSMIIEATSLGAQVVKEGLVQFSLFHENLLEDFSSFEIDNVLLATNMLSHMVRKKS